jgi:adenine-specific DNA-methyltransferase
MSEMSGTNADIAQEQKDKLKELFPEVFSEGKVDWSKLKATLGEEIDLGERYGLSWKGKSDVFSKIQEKTVSTLHAQPEESVDWDTTQNMFIEGDNLEALKVLHKAYYGKIRMIYIDPPYNTGNDFVYNDDFAKTKRQQALEEGTIDEEGNITRDDGLRVNTGGHKHSNWLDMMYPRLFLARNLLRQDGVIFVSIDDNEVHNLRLIMNEIFGEENFAGQFIWEKRVTRENRRNISIRHDYIVAYSRMSEKQDEAIKNTPMDDVALSRYSNPDDDKRGVWTSAPATAQAGHATKSQFYSFQTPGGRTVSPPAGRCWLYTEKRMKEEISKNNIWFGKDGNGVPRIKKFLKDEQGLTPETIWWAKNAGTNDSAKRALISLFDGKAVFDTPKPVELIKTMLRVGTDENSIVADFFSGTSTLAHALMELNAEDGGNRKHIQVQLPEMTEKGSEAFIAGYTTIAAIARDRIRRAGTKISKDFADKIAERDTPLDLGFRSYVLGDSNFKKWNELVTEPEEIKQQALDNLDPLEDGAKDEDLLTEILLKRGISPLTETESHGDFVLIPSESLAVSLSSKMTQDLFNQILATKPSQIILLDTAFQNDVNLKTNLALQAKKQNITLEVL